MKLADVAQGRDNNFNLIRISAVLAVLAGQFVLPVPGPFPRLFFMFFAGASCYLLRGRLILSARLFWFFLGSLVLASCNRQAFFIVYICSIVYITLYAASVPAGILRTYSRLGDYSYGVYIYAFPVQQSVAALMPGISAGVLLAVSATLTSLAVVVSRHLLELPGPGPQKPVQWTAQGFLTGLSHADQGPGALRKKTPGCLSVRACKKSGS